MHTGPWDAGNANVPEVAQLTNSDYQRSLLEGIALFQGVCPDDIQGLLQQCERTDLAEGE